MRPGKRCSIPPMTGGARTASATAVFSAALETSTTSLFSLNGRVWKRRAHSQLPRNSRPEWRVQASKVRLESTSSLRCTASGAALPTEPAARIFSEDRHPRGSASISGDSHPKEVEPATRTQPGPKVDASVFAILLSSGLPPNSQLKENFMPKKPSSSNPHKASAQPRFHQTARELQPFGTVTNEMPLQL